MPKLRTAIHRTTMSMVQMPFNKAFGNHPILEDAAKECTEQLKVKFQEFIKTCQKDILASRRAAVEKLLELLTNYKQECLKIQWTYCLAGAMQERFKKKYLRQPICCQSYGQETSDDVRY